MSEESIAQREAQSQPGSVEEARRAVEQTRTRISDTLDALEQRLGDRTRALKNRADILRPARMQIRQRPDRKSVV